jgi:uncharacterized protein YfaS (alpha-2-macroglobulin family)
LLAATLALPSLSWAARVEVFSPQGEVKSVRQVAARFSEPMVALGDPRLDAPFEIDCPQGGTARWADQKNWVFDFARDLPAGIRCTFTVKAGLNALSGQSVESGTFAFTTGGPAVIESLPSREDIVDEEQIFILGLDAPVDSQTVVQYAYCDARGVAEKIPVRVVTGEQRLQLLEQRRDFIDRYLSALYKDGRLAAIAQRDLLRGTRAEQLQQADEAKFPVLLLRCARRLPSDAPLRLIWGKGIASLSGVKTSADQALEFKVRPAFTAAFSCERVNRDADCLPFLPMRLSLTAPVARAMAARIALRNAQGKTYKSTLPDPAQDGDFVQEVSFAGPFPEQAEFKLEVPADLRDDAGRKLANQKRFPLTVKTDVAPPLAKFAARFGIIEWKADPTLPVTLRNVEAELPGRQWSAGENVPGAVLRVGNANGHDIASWLRRLEEAQRIEWQEAEGDEKPVARYAAEQSIFTDRDATRAIKVPKPNGARAFEVVGIPLKQPGFYVVELASPKLGAALLADPQSKAKPVYHVSAGALVTNLAVHFKHGRESSLVWVTALDSGEPVAKAAVSVQDCGGKEHWRGVTDSQGVARILSALPERRTLPGCLNDYDRQYVVLARSSQDVSFVLSDWNEGITRWRFNLPVADYGGPYISTSVLDRTLVRAGETVHMKHFYRQHVRAGFGFVPAAGLPAKAIIQHVGSDQRYEIALKWDAKDIAESSWDVPKDAKTGVYQIVMEDTLVGREERRRRVSGTFRVEEFRVPLMRASIDAPAKPLINPESVDLSLQVSYLAGGGASGLPVRLRSVVQPRAVSFSGYEEFQFAGGPVKEGLEEPSGGRWSRGGYALSDDDMAEPAAEGSTQTRPLKTLTLALDAAGGAKAVLTGIGKQETPQEILAELEYADPNGEVLTSSSRVALWPAKIVLGIKPDSWALSKDRVKFETLALDIAGKPLSGVALKLDVFERKRLSHRTRLVGGFYAYHSGVDVKRLQTACEGTTDEHGRLFCEFASPVAGEIVVQASTRDDEGNLAATSTSVWVAGSGEWWFDASNDDRMDVIPQRKRYEPGDKAVFQVRMPFRKASALVTVEREGVMEAFVTELSGKSPVVELNVRGFHAPNVFVSVLAVRGRVGDVQPTALVDLGKPAFKMGVAQINVGWQAHELKVDVKADRSVYRVRDKARISVQVTRQDGKALPRDAEIVLAAVDEGLLELAPNDSWKLLDTMMQRRGIEVDTATAAMQVVGKRHYGRKAREPGGGGGRRASRELFETLLFWRARIKLDAQGRANVEVPLNDSLTSFRIVAVANATAGLFGTGQTSIRSSQDVMVFSGLPPLVREQDKYRATFTVRNASDAPLAVELQAKVDPPSVAKPPLTARTAQLQPGASADLSWWVSAPIDVDALRWEISALATRPDGASSRDSMRVIQKVIPALPVRTFQATLVQIDKPFELTVALPRDALPSRGGVHVELMNSLAGELSGVHEYMSRYPYTCLEQLASQAVALSERSRWDAVMAMLPSYLDRDGFAKYFALMREGSDVLTAYVLNIAAQSAWDIPEGTRSRMMGALEGFVQGRLQRDAEWRAADLSIRRLAALQALSRWGRKVTDADLAPLSIEPNLWPTSAVIDWFDLLKRVPELSAHDERMREAAQILRSRLNFQGTTMNFSTERTDYLWWLMISGDVNANRILLSMLDQDEWRADVPRLARGALGRQQRGHWNTTVANAWGVLAVQAFAQKFEQQQVAGVTSASLAGTQKQLDWQKQADGGAMTFAWPPAPSALNIKHGGAGAPWAMVQSRAAIALTEPLSSGYRIARSITPIEQKSAGRWMKGDVLRVRLDLDAQSDMSWVVVNDPVPAGSTILGTGLARDSQIVTSGETKQGWVWPAFEERKFDSFRAYYRFVPKGKWSVEYTVRLNNAGEFMLPETRVEAMYAPEMFGESPNAKFKVDGP